MPAPLAVRADVRTGPLERYAEQLDEHLGRVVSLATVGAVSSAEIAGGIGSVDVVWAPAA